MSSAIGPSSVVDVKPTVMWVDVDGELVLLDEATGDLHLLNPIAGLVFRCLGSGTLAELASDFAAELGGDEDEILAEILDLVRDLRARGLIDGDR